MISQYTVIIDTREQKPLSFDNADKCIGSIRQKLDTGDYTILGYERIITIERKASVEEIAQNIVQDRFYKELDRMQAFKYKFIVCEFSLYDILTFPQNKFISKAVQKTTKITGSFILKKLTEISMKYNVHIIYCNNRTNAVSYIDSMFKRVLELECPRQLK